MEIRELINRKNIKLTKQREQIIEALVTSDKPLSLDEIEEQCNEVDFSSVFRTIKLFTVKGIVKEHYFGDRKPKYNLVIDKNHNHYIKCVNCGKLEELKNVCVLDDVNKKTSFQIIDHYMEFMGLCPDCSKK